MPNGSLENCLYSSTCTLDIFQRLNIMIDVCISIGISPFRSFDSYNSLDFGIAKLLSGEDQLSKQTQTLATIGYMAPEYGTKGRVSTREYTIESPEKRINAREIVSGLLKIRDTLVKGVGMFRAADDDDSRHYNKNIRM
ncbi:hypothetical protein CUMW_198490 [Citrus unshiu]|nr:hypothetical protein CUMW_198490 [Citrus unshiu]